MKYEDGNLVLKYFDLLDEFIRVRVFADNELGIVSRVDVHNKAEYRQAVIRECLPDATGPVRSRLKALEDDYDPMTIEDLLYQVCIDVNPGLEIHHVSLPAPGEPEVHDESIEDGTLLAVPREVASLERSLKRRIVGQDEAVERLAKSIKKAAIGLKRPNTPVGTFFLVGRTGTGKTEIAKALAASLWCEPGKLVRIDCSEYALPHEYAKLIGSPPGYIGHAEGGYLTEAVKAKKNCVVLFDEIEKAHHKVHNLLLQILDEGMLTDSRGETVSFQDAIILLTSNVGIEQIDQVRTRMGFDWKKRISLEQIDHKTITREALRESFRPEFLNRIDEIVVFNPLYIEDCVRIAGKMLSQISELLGKRGFEVRFSSGLKRHLAKVGFSEEFGARELDRLIKREVEDRLVEAILDAGLGSGSRLYVRVRSGRVVVEIVTEDSAESVASGVDVSSPELEACKA
ncbi:MAG: ATP-dependent Clp protease ATP-binding subunit [Planctomycetes bacterium]|nr:ATP-dependent Clp protease ATP-binding subunit [Planctomycetota bacterium]